MARGASQVQYVILVGVLGLGSIQAFHVLNRGVGSAARKEGACIVDLNGKCTAPPASATPAIASPAVAPREGPVAGNPVCTSADGCVGFACFVAGTKVSTREGLVPIERVTVGTLVLAIDPARGEHVWRPVTRTFARRSPSLVALTVRNDQAELEQIHVTPEHPFYAVDSGWLSAAALAPGMRVLAADAVVHVDAIASVPPSNDAESEPVFNLEVDDVHTYAVGRMQTVVHNECAPDGKKGSHGLAVPTGDAVDTAVQFEKCVTGGFGGSAEKVLTAAGVTKDVLKKVVEDAIKDARIACAKSVAEQLGKNAPSTTVSAEFDKCMRAASAKLSKEDYWPERVAKTTGKMIAKTVAAPFVTAVECAVAGGMLLGLGFAAVYHDVYGEFPTTWGDLDREWKETLKRESTEKVEVQVFESTDPPFRVEVRPHRHGVNALDKRPSYDVRVKYDGTIWSEHSPRIGVDDKYDEWLHVRPEGNGVFAVRGGFSGNYVELTPGAAGQPWKVRVSRSSWWSWSEVTTQPIKVTVPKRILTQ